MKGAEQEFVVHEHFDNVTAKEPSAIYLGRLISRGARSTVDKYSLKKRKYINTTSMDAELALITANLALAAPGKLCYDPFVGTASFPIACAHFGATAFGSDMDGRTIRGTKQRDVLVNFEQYGLRSSWMDGFIADLTNTPLRLERCLDAILCDPPYGIREGLKVLGRKDGTAGEAIYIDGIPSHT
jgi:tRNA (guanine10-N2)-methyltransferase